MCVWCRAERFPVVWCGLRLCTRCGFYPQSVRCVGHMQSSQYHRCLLLLHTHADSGSISLCPAAGPAPHTCTTASSAPQQHTQQHWSAPAQPAAPP